MRVSQNYGGDYKHKNFTSTPVEVCEKNMLLVKRLPASFDNKGFAGGGEKKKGGGCKSLWHKVFRVL